MAANRWSPFLLALLISALAAPATALPAGGNLTIEGALGLEGSIHHSPDAGALLITGPDPGAPSELVFRADAALVNVTHVRWNRIGIANPAGGGPIAYNSQPVVEYADYRDAHVELTLSRDDLRLVAHGESLDAAMSRVTFTDAQLQGITRSYLVTNWGGGRGDTRANAPEEYNYQVENTFGLASTQGGAATLVGNLEAYAYGADLQVIGRDAKAAYSTGETAQDPGQGIDAISPSERSFLILRLETATLTYEGGKASTTWFGHLDGLHVLGNMTASKAAGTLTVDDRAHPAKGQSIRIEGDVLLHSKKRTPGDPDELDYTYTVPDSAFDIGLEGDVTFISVSASATPFVAAPAAAAAATGLALFLLTAAYFWPALKYTATHALLPLYTRLKEPELLNNEIRNQIYEIIRQNPGMSARAIHRRSGQSWGTVVYHLRQLEKHHLVKSRRVGRSRNFYENHGKYSGMEVELAVLKNARSLALARYVLAEPGITQERLKELADLPQPTTSYYVRKLKDAGLIQERREGRYSRYFPEEELATLVRIVTQGPHSESTSTPSEALA